MKRRTSGLRLQCRAARKTLLRGLVRKFGTYNFGEGKPMVLEFEYESDRGTPCENWELWPLASTARGGSEAAESERGVMSTENHELGGTVLPVLNLERPFWIERPGLFVVL